MACSRWEEPFGRTSLEASANGCAVVITNKGGLPETVTDAKIINNLNVKKLTSTISLLIKDTKLRKKLQYLSIKSNLSRKRFSLKHWSKRIHRRKIWRKYVLGHRSILHSVLHGNKRSASGSQPIAISLQSP